jgi:hypothetical protein
VLKDDDNGKQHAGSMENQYNAGRVYTEHGKGITA